MKKLLDLITEEVVRAFEACDYKGEYGKVTLSNRPDLCEYQCNGCLAAAKEYHCAPIQIADKVVEKLGKSSVFAEALAVRPGFINLKVSNAYVQEYLRKMTEDERLGCDKTDDHH